MAHDRRGKLVLMDRSIAAWLPAVDDNEDKKDSMDIIVGMCSVIQ